MGGSEETAEETIPREKFMEAYIELRITGLKAEGQEMTLTMRNRVLDSLGVTEEELLHFVDVHGTDVGYMRSLWEEVDSVLDARRRPEALPSDPGPS